jgi:uncharacterized protein (TIGR00255 family)
MTGFGVGSTALGAGRVSVEVRTVNGRFFDARVRMPQGLLELAGCVEDRARKRLARGRCEIVVRAEGAIGGRDCMDTGRAAAVYRTLLELRDQIAPGTDVPFSMLSAFPDLWAGEPGQDTKALDSALIKAVDEALGQVEVMREKEGALLAAELGQRLEHVHALVRELSGRASGMLQRHAAKLRERLEHLGCRLDDAGIDGKDVIDPARLEQELVLFADRSDITEELARLDIHTHQLKSYIEMLEPTGRRFDFLLQEMTREINTVGAKSQDAEISHAVVELKAEIEKMREQIQNVE